MSRYEFRLREDDDRIVTVALGYDRPLNYVFCTVMRDGEEDSPIYSNLDDEEAGIHLQDVNYFRPILAKLGIDIPEWMFLEVELDQAEYIGNQEKGHT